MLLCPIHVNNSRLQLTEQVPSCGEFTFPLLSFTIANSQEMTFIFNSRLFWRILFFPIRQPSCLRLSKCWQCFNKVLSCYGQRLFFFRQGEKYILRLSWSSIFSLLRPLFIVTAFGIDQQSNLKEQMRRSKQKIRLSFSLARLKLAENINSPSAKMLVPILQFHGHQRSIF